MRLTAHGFAVDLPARWEAAVQTTHADDRVMRRAARTGVQVHAPPALHLSTAGLPTVRGDFGSGAVDLLSATDAFVAVVEYGPENLGTALFETGLMPRRLDRAAFTPAGLQRTIPGQSGLQHFCTERGRALCLYVVLGAHANAGALVREVNGLLPHIEIQHR